MYSAAELVGGVVELLFSNKSEVTRFNGFGALESLYTRTAPPSRQGELGTPAIYGTWGPPHDCM